ncbi:hypothetical protein LJR016_004321 [Devosia sp. LjRoot16]|uniref:hypothetical protein n=1 Tax=Devosia sp. LjRoot16 TaxID=3342271 RepID=UPI003ECDE2C2
MPDIITMPDALYAFSELAFNLVTVNTASGPSAFNPIASVNGPSAEYWEVEMTFVPLTGDDLDEMERFISANRGGKVLVRIYDKRRAAFGGRSQPRGAGGAGPVINVAADVAGGAETVTFKNLTPSRAVALKAMDQFRVGENLYRIQDSGASDVGGEGTFSFRPAARHGWAEDDPVALVLPTGLFRMVGGETGFGIGNSPRLISRPLTLNFREDPDFDA